MQSSLIELFRLWLGIGTQSFGGGAATIYLIRQAVVERRGWLTDAEFTEAWAICQLTPGINLLALTAMIGWRRRGVGGVAASLMGLLLPSASITALIAASYSAIQRLPLIQAAVRGIIPATVGIGLLLSYQLARPYLQASRAQGRGAWLFSVALLLAGALWFGLAQPPVLAVLWGSGALAAAVEWGRRRAAGRST